MKRFLLSLLTAGLLLLSGTGLAHSLPDTEMTLGPLTFGTPFTTVSALFGEDYRKEEISSEFGRLVWHHYLEFSVLARPKADEAELRIAAVRVTGRNLATRSGFVAMPCGIEVGSTYATVVEHFGAVPVLRFPGEPDVYSYESNTSPGRCISFTVDKQGIITMISLEQEL